MINGEYTGQTNNSITAGQLIETAEELFLQKDIIIAITFSSHFRFILFDINSINEYPFINVMLNLQNKCYYATSV